MNKIGFRDLLGIVLVVAALAAVLALRSPSPPAIPTYTPLLTATPEVVSEPPVAATATLVPQPTPRKKARPRAPAPVYNPPPQPKPREVSPLPGGKAREGEGLWVH